MSSQEIESEVYSSINTIYIKICLRNKGRMTFDSPRKAGEYFLKEFKRLKSANSIKADTYKYFIKRFNPLNNHNFIRIIETYAARYQEVKESNKQLEGKDDYQRIIEVIQSLREENKFVVRIGSNDEEAFTEAEYSNIKKHGLVNVPLETKKSFVGGWLQNNGAITYIVPHQSVVQKIIAKLQSAGFGVLVAGTVVTTNKPGQIVFRTSKVNG